MEKILKIESTDPSKEFAEFVKFQVEDSKQEISIFMTLPIRINIEHGSLNIKVEEVM